MKDTVKVVNGEAYEEIHKTRSGMPLRRKEEEVG